MGAMKKMALQLLSICEYAEVKIGLGDGMIALFNEYLTSYGNLFSQANRVIRGEVSKEHALKQVDEVIKKISGLSECAITFFSKEPSENPYVVEFNTCLTEAGEQRLEVVLRVNINLEDRTDIPTIENGYTNAMNLFTQIKNIKDEEEDVAKNQNTDVNL